MNIDLIKFGSDLHGRPSGKDAYESIAVRLNNVKDHELITVDFKGVASFSTSWLDEILTPLQEKFGDRLRLKNVTNLSAKLSLDTLRKVGGKHFIVE
jgi:hypothetical protein